jgi:hypothetical protein
MSDTLSRVRHAFSLVPGVWRDFRKVGRQLCDMRRAACNAIRLMRRGEWSRRRQRSECCIRVPDVYIRPDPLIYAQHYLMARGLSVTWDNPDIELFDGGVPVSSASLQPDREYEVKVRVWNGSYDAPIVGLPVTLSFLSFGIATTSNAIAKTYINLGAKGTSQCPAFASFKWRTPPRPGHYCLQAQLDWADDANPDNNLGQENVNVGVLASPAQFVFTLRNDASVRRRFVLEPDTYRLPAIAPCDDEYRRAFGAEAFRTRIEESRARWAWALRTQAYGRFSELAGWSVAIEPREVVLEAREERDIHVAIEPRDAGFTGSKSFNIHAFALSADNSRRLAGGVTLVVRR